MGEHQNGQAGIVKVRVMKRVRTKLSKNVKGSDWRDNQAKPLTQTLGQDPMQRDWATQIKIQGEPATSVNVAHSPALGYCWSSFPRFREQDRAVGSS